MKTLNKLFLLSLLWLLSNSAFSQPIFPTTDTNLNQTITEIQQIYGTQIGIDTSDIYNFVYPFVQGTTGSGCPAPEPQIQQLGNGSVSFSWPPVSAAVSYGYYYINLNTGVSFSSTTNVPGVSFSGLQGLYLFGFYTICGDGTRSPSSVIIVDIDVLFPDGYVSDCSCDKDREISLNEKWGIGGTFFTTPWTGRCASNQYRLKVNGIIPEGDLFIPYYSELSFIYQSEFEVPTFWLLPDCDINAVSSVEDPLHIGSGLDPYLYNLVFSPSGLVIYFPHSSLELTSISFNDCGCSTPEDPFAVINDVPSSLVSSFNVFPNPAQNQTQVNYELLESSEVQITFYDPLGRMVKQILPATQQNRGKHKIEVDLSQWPKGMYYCQLMTGQIIKILPLRKE